LHKIKSVKIFCFILTLFLFIVSGIEGQQTAKEFKIKRTISVPGNGSWDNLTLDYLTMRIFVAHEDCVQVIDVNTGQLVGTIDHTPGVHNITIVREFGKGFITAGTIDSVIVFDVNNHQITNRIPTGKDPDAILFDRFSQRVFTFNAKGNSITVIDPKTSEVQATVPLRGSPSSALTDASGNIYVSLVNTGIIAMIDPVTLETRTLLPIGVDKQPVAIALDKANDLLFCGCRGTNQMIVIDRFSGSIVIAIPIGMHCEGICYMPALNEIFTSNGEGTVTIIRQDTPDKYSKIQTLITKRGARTLLCDYAHQSIFLPVAEYNYDKKDYDPDSFQLLVVSK
jgi:YVTN family beta-propeller protein